MPIIGQRDKLLSLVKSVANGSQIEAKLLDAIVVVESCYDPLAVRYESHYSANIIPNAYAKAHNISVETEKQLYKFSWGLCQVMGGTARFVGYGGPILGLLEPQMNLFVGCLYLKKLKGIYPMMQDVIAAYNAGRPKRDKTGKYVNQEYVDKVLKTMERLSI